MLGFEHCIGEHCWQELMLSRVQPSCCSKIAEAEAGVSVNEKKWLVMHVHVKMLKKVS
jgi:hypothetical protein